MHDHKFKKKFKKKGAKYAYSSQKKTVIQTVILLYVLVYMPLKGKDKTSKPIPNLFSKLKKTENRFGIGSYLILQGAHIQACIIIYLMINTYRVFPLT